MRINEIITSPEDYYRNRIQESVVRPYLSYLRGIGQYLAEDAQLGQQAAQAIADQTAQGREVVLPPEIEQRFQQELSAIPPGEVQGFEQKAEEEIEKIADPVVKQSLLQRAKDAVKNPATQQTILAAISSIAGMAAGAATLGLGAETAKKATQTLGTGIIAAVNHKLAGAGWKAAVKQAFKHGGTQAAADELDIDHTDAKAAVGIDKTNAGIAPGNTGDLTNKWQEFINYGQKLVQQMAQSGTQATKPA